MSTKADYTDLATMKAYLKITNTAEDTVLSRLITGVSDWIDGYCGRTFGSEIGGQRLLNGSGTKTLHLAEDVTAITLLEVAMYENAAYLTVPGTDFFLEPQQDNQPGWPYLYIEFGMLPSTSVGAFYRGHRTVRITGNWGWASVPTAVAEACVQTVAAIHKRRLAGPNDTLGGGGMGITGIGKYVPDFVAASLFFYKNIHVGSSSAG